MAVKRYRKRPVVIEAVQWTGKNVMEVYSFMHGAPTLDSAAAQDKWFDFENIHAGKDWHIKTLEDGPNGEAKHVASVGDWIIKGVQGEFYPCKPDIFEVTYEVDDAANNRLINAVHEAVAILSGSPSPQTNVVPPELCELTFAIQHNPNCPSPWLVRLVGKSGIIDMKPYGGLFSFMKHETTDRLGFGKTLEEAARAALATTEGQDNG